MRTVGKWFNVQHQRPDSWHCKVDQLILEVLLFTLFTFSLPTYFFLNPLHAPVGTEPYVAHAPIQIHLLLLSLG